jgi:hypothetical protein
MQAAIYQKVLNLMYEIPVDDTDVPKHVGIVKDLTFKLVCNFALSWFYK